MPPNDTSKRDVTLSEGEYAYTQDSTKGTIKVHTGPINLSPQPNDSPIIFDLKRGFIVVDSLQKAVMKAPVARENDYVVLLNPIAKEAGENMHPGPATALVLANELAVGRKVNLRGPQMFALYPGQHAKVIEGHQLRYNEYLVIQVYNVDEARKNWAQVVATPSTTKDDKGAIIPHVAPADLAIGQRFNVKGTEVSFYIPPTGVKVLHSDTDENVYVRAALSLEQMEFAILIDENGKKRYPRGPDVIFPKPTEQFVKNKVGETKFRVFELTKVQGVHVNVIADYEDYDVDNKTEAKRKYKAGEELFIVGGGRNNVYCPREEHTLNRYDGVDKHFGVRIPSGEGRYLMSKEKGDVRMVRGPAVHLANPIFDVFARRVLTAEQCELWYPGNVEVREYNAQLAEYSKKSPTTRTGALSEGDFRRQSGQQGAYMTSMDAGGLESFGAGPLIGASAGAMPSNRSGGVMPTSGNTRSAKGMSGDISDKSEKANYSAPPSIVVNSKLDGVPAIKPWLGFAVKVVSKSGKSRIEKGPNTVLLEFDEELEFLTLSTQTPKTSDRLRKTVYLQIANNKVSDSVDVETSDHVKVNLSYSLNINFEGDENKWFNDMNYVKLVTDHVRSVLKGTVRKLTVEAFSLDATSIIRDTVLGSKGADGKTPRTGMLFDSNGARVSDVDVKEVIIHDAAIREALAQSARLTVQQNILLNNKKRELEQFRLTETINRELLVEKSSTEVKKNDLMLIQHKSTFDLEQGRILLQQAAQADIAKLNGLKELLEDTQLKARLAREQLEAQSNNEISRKQQELELDRLVAESTTLVNKIEALGQHLAPMVAALHDQGTLVKVAEAMSVQRFMGGNSFVEVLEKTFGATPVGGMLAKAMKNAETLGLIPANGVTQTKPTPAQQTRT